MQGGRAQITRICTITGNMGALKSATQIGGSRATTVASDDHAARPLFQSVSEPSAEYALIHPVPSGADVARRLSVTAQSQ